MATKKVNASSRRYTYGFAGAEFPDLQSARWKAEKEYERLCAKYGGRILERLDQALQEEENSVWLKLTYVVEE